MIVTQIFRDLRPDHCWSPHCPPNFPKSNAASIGIHISSNIRSVGKWMGVITGDGRSGHADLGTIDKIERSNREMHDFGHTFEVENLDYQSLNKYIHIYIDDVYYPYDSFSLTIQLQSCVS